MMDAGIQRANHWLVQCFNRDGSLAWEEDFWNLIPTVGLNDALDKHLKASAYTAAWYVGLTTASPLFAAGDTASSHVGWTESTAYTEATRRTLTLGTVSGGSVNNSASKATFSINAPATIGGVFISSSSTKGGSSGVLAAEGAFSANRSMDSGQTLEVQVTMTATSV